MYKQRLLISLSTALALTYLMSGCATKQPTLYEWQGYQKNLYEYFQKDVKGADILAASMEDDLKKITASGGAVPPGYYAHLGLLYGKQGKLDEFKQQLDIEKKQFPESEVFVNFLLRNFKSK
jgi:hypothetical protein